MRRLEALLQTDLAEVIDAAVTKKLERLEAARFPKTKVPRRTVEDTGTSPMSSRYLPAAVKRAVCARDGNRCTFVDEHGRRCTERHRLEFHHDDPFGKGGAHSVDNVRMLCRTHNLYLAERDYGKDVMDAFRRSSAKSTGRVSEPQPVYLAWTSTALGTSSTASARPEVVP